MSGFGTVTDAITGEQIREATAAEWRRTANRPGAWQDAGGRTVTVTGGPDTEVTAEDIAALERQADATIRLCRAALHDSGDKAAWTLLRTYILDARMAGEGRKSG